MKVEQLIAVIGQVKLSSRETWSWLWWRLEKKRPRGAEDAEDVVSRSTSPVHDHVPDHFPIA